MPEYPPPPDDLDVSLPNSPENDQHDKTTVFGDDHGDEETSKQTKRYYINDLN